MTESDTQDLKDLLTEFWIQMMHSGPDPTDQIKCSELLAKYILDGGRPRVKRIGASKPSTSDVLQLVQQMEQVELEGEGEDS